MVRRARNISLQDDLAVLAGTVLTLNDDPDNKDKLAQVALAVRVVVERSKRWKLRKNAAGRNSMDQVYSTVNLILTDLTVARLHAARLTDPDLVVGQIWPLYVKSGLVP